MQVGERSDSNAVVPMKVTAEKVGACALDRQYLQEGGGHEQRLHVLQVDGHRPVVDEVYQLRHALGVDVAQLDVVHLTLRHAVGEHRSKVLRVRGQRQSVRTYATIADVQAHVAELLRPIELRNGGDRVERVPLLLEDGTFDHSVVLTRQIGLLDGERLLRLRDVRRARHDHTGSVFTRQNCLFSNSFKSISTSTECTKSTRTRSSWKTVSQSRFASARD